VAFFNEAKARIEMHLEARRDLDVSWPDDTTRRVRHFAAGERVHTENSYKYSPAGFETLLREAGFADIRMWTDPRAWFALFFARQGNTRT
jgi:uncharacterized SAM-dependent methyltransferase